MKTTIVLRGELTEKELLAILQAIREVDTRRPEAEVKVDIRTQVEDRERTKELLEKVIPPFSLEEEVQQRVVWRAPRFPARRQTAGAPGWRASSGGSMLQNRGDP